MRPLFDRMCAPVDGQTAQLGKRLVAKIASKWLFAGGTAGVMLHRFRLQRTLVAYSAYVLLGAFIEADAALRVRSWLGTLHRATVGTVRRQVSLVALLVHF